MVEILLLLPERLIICELGLVPNQFGVKDWVLFHSYSDMQTQFGTENA